MHFLPRRTSCDDAALKKKKKWCCEAVLGEEHGCVETHGHLALGGRGSGAVRV